MRFFSLKNPGRQHSTAPYGNATPAPVSVPNKKESNGVIAEGFADRAEILINQVEIKITAARGLSLDVVDVAKQLGFARATLVKARKSIGARDLLMAKAEAESALRLAELVKEIISDLIAKQERLAARCRKIDGCLSETRFEVAAALERGALLRKTLADADWPGFRWLDQAAENRAKEAQELITELEAKLARGELDEIEFDAERAEAWIKQADGYAKTSKALDKFLSSREKYLADQVDAVHEFMIWTVSTFRNIITREAAELTKQTESLYRQAKGTGDTKAHEEVLKQSLTVASLIEAQLLENAKAWIIRRRGGGFGSWNWTVSRFGSLAYNEIARLESSAWLSDLFARVLTEKEQRIRDEARYPSGLSCPCCP